MTFGVVILAGGRSTRFPGKLTAAAGAQTLIARVVDAFARCGETVVSTSPENAFEIGELVARPVVCDELPQRGPVGGLLAAFAAMRSRFVFVTTGDAPFVDAEFAAWLATRRHDGDEALVPIHADAAGERRTEYLAALYDREAFLRAGTSVIREGRGAMYLVVERLRTRFVTVDDGERLFTNVNTPEDYAAFVARLAQETR